MSEVIINEQNLIDIADAIRLKLGVETEYKPSEMAGAIEEIEGGTYGTKEIDSNGTYNASDDGYTGYSQVTVNVQGGGGQDKVKVIKRIGYLYDAWYITATGILKYDSSDPECLLEIFEVQAGHKYVWCFGSNNGNRGTVAFTEHDIYHDPINNLSCSLKFKLEDAERIAYQSRPILNITLDGYIGAYTANAMGTDSESYLIDITDIDN